MTLTQKVCEMYRSKRRVSLQLAGSDDLESYLYDAGCIAVKYAVLCMSEPKPRSATPFRTKALKEAVTTAPIGTKTACRDEAIRTFRWAISCNMEWM